MRTLAERMKWLLNEMNKSQQWLADQVKVSQQAIGKILSGNTLNPKNILEIAQVLNVDPNWLKTGEGEPPKIDGVMPVLLENEPADRGFKIEVLDLSASAGNGAIVKTDLMEVVTSIEYTTEYFKSVFKTHNASAIKVINVKGDSMSPTLESGDLIFVNIDIRSYDGDGIYVFHYGDNLYVKRLQMAGDELFVISDNSFYKEWKIGEHNQDKFHIQGKVLVGQSQNLKRFG